MKKIGQEGDTNGKEYYKIERQPTIQEENTLKKRVQRRKITAAENLSMAGIFKVVNVIDYRLWWI